MQQIFMNDDLHTMCSVDIFLVSMLHPQKETNMKNQYKKEQTYAWFEIELKNLVKTIKFRLDG